MSCITVHFIREYNRRYLLEKMGKRPDTCACATSAGEVCSKNLVEPFEPLG